MADLIHCLSSTIDLVSPQLADHHQRVGGIAYDLAAQLGLPEEARLDLYFAGNLHDIGAFSLQDRLRLLDFEIDETNAQAHGESGAVLLELFPPLARLAGLVRFHHLGWNDGAGLVERECEVPLGSHILHLADRIAVLAGGGDGGTQLVRVPAIRETVKAASGTLFAPLLVEAFNDLSTRESFWLGMTLPGRDRSEQLRHLQTIDLDSAGVIGLSRLFARIIDYRSRFTATHSSGVAASAEALAFLSQRPLAECEQMRIAGLLHDLGKLAVPAELLEKTAVLTGEEKALIRCHTFFTRRALESISSFDAITRWSADHHERVDGQGYPCHLKGNELSEGSRIMAVADVFTALTEDRPYRAGMDRDTAKKTILDMVAQAALDADIAQLLLRNFDELNTIRAQAQHEAVSEYGEIRCKLAAVPYRTHAAC